MQQIDLTCSDADQKLLATDLNQHSAFFGAQRCICDDLDNVGTELTEAADSSNDPRRGEYHGENQQQRQRDLRQAAGCGNRYMLRNLRSRKRLLSCGSSIEYCEGDRLERDRRDTELDRRHHRTAVWTRIVNLLRHACSRDHFSFLMRSA